MLFQAGPLKTRCTVTNIWQNRLTSIHPSILLFIPHPSSFVSSGFAHLPSAPSTVWCLRSAFTDYFTQYCPLRLLNCGRPFELLDIDYQHLKWKAIMSISIWHKGFTADDRVIWINTTLLCHWRDGSVMEKSFLSNSVLQSRQYKTAFIMSYRKGHAVQAQFQPWRWNTMSWHLG